MYQNDSEIQSLKKVVSRLKKENSRLKEAIVDITVKNSVYRKRTSQCKTLFSDYILQWLETNQRNWQATTYEGYRSNVKKHIAPYFAEKRLSLCDITSNDISTYFKEKTNSGLSSNSLIKHYNNIHGCFAFAKKERLIEDNPCDNIPKPSSIIYEAANYTSDELHSLFNVFKGTPFFLPVLLASVLGLRRSEVLRLKWDAIDFQNRTISIKSKMVRITENGKDVILFENRMKNRTSNRILALPDQLLQFLKYIKLIRTQKKFTICSEYSDFLCIKDDGSLITPTNLSNTFARTIKRNDLRYIRFHDLRHSCASILYSLGYGLKDIQMWLGHSSISTTANIYIHLNQEKLFAMADMIEKSFQLNLMAAK